jgi:5-(carboxyamino)imidazole ribonucleotide synthase
MTTAILPGATIGVLGSGQLGRMFTIAARRLGYRVHVLSPDNDTPTGQVADVEWNASYLDLDAVRKFAQSVDVVTFEFENVPHETTAAIDRMVPVRPAGTILQTTQNRIREKKFLTSIGIPVAPYATVGNEEELQQAISTFPQGGILKSAAWGYDGKGQVPLKSAAEGPAGWRTLQSQDAVWEQFIDFQSEASIVAARSILGDICCFPPTTNVHRNHILDISISPSRLPPRKVLEAQDIARTIVQALDLVGVLCVEFFYSQDGTLLVNELAPRPHNSGHLTIDAHASCQFEQQVRAVCGLPLGSAEQLIPAAMANLLGEWWESGPPRWDSALEDAAVKLHLYGKKEPRVGRKMGHLTALASDVDDAVTKVVNARQKLVHTLEYSN